MKVIFLDVDGVLDIFNPNNYLQVIEENALIQLKTLIDKTDAKVVIISSLRQGSESYVSNCKIKEIDKRVCDNWEHLVKSLKNYGIEIYDITPLDVTLKTRSEEIRAYLDIHTEVKEAVILDDCFQDDYTNDRGLHNILVFVDCAKGLSSKDVDKAITILNSSALL